MLQLDGIVLSELCAGGDPGESVVLGFNRICRWASSARVLVCRSLRMVFPVCKQFLGTEATEIQFPRARLFVDTTRNIGRRRVS